MYQFWHINLIWFQYVFYYNIETCINFETFIAGTFGYKPSSSTGKSMRNNFEQNSTRSDGMSEWQSKTMQWWDLVGVIKKEDENDNYNICLENICLFVQSRGVVMVTLSG